MSELPNGLTWSQAPKWANVLLDAYGDSRELPGYGDVSRYSWAASNETGAKRQYAQGAMITARVERSRMYRLVAVRPDN